MDKIKEIGIKPLALAMAGLAFLAGGGGWVFWLCWWECWESPV